MRWWSDAVRATHGLLTLRNLSRWLLIVAVVRLGYRWQMLWRNTNAGGTKHTVLIVPISSPGFIRFYTRYARRCGKRVSIGR